MNHLYKFSLEITELENSPSLLGLHSTSLSKKFISSTAEFDNSCHKDKNLNYDLQFSKILHSIKNTFDSTQESDCVPERSSLNYIPEYDNSDMVSREDLPQNQSKKYSLDEFAILKLQEDSQQNERIICAGDSQILQNKNNTDFAYFNDIEEKIFKWLDQQGVQHVSPQDKMDDYYVQKKKLISSQIIYSCKILNENAEEDTKPVCKIRKQSLLERRKQLNKNKPAPSPSSCINLGQILSRLPSDFKEVSTMCSAIEVDELSNQMISVQEL